MKSSPPKKKETSWAFPAASRARPSKSKNKPSYHLIKIWMEYFKFKSILNKKGFYLVVGKLNWGIGHTHEDCCWLYDTAHERLARRPLIRQVSIHGYDESDDPKRRGVATKGDAYYDMIQNWEGASVLTKVTTQNLPCCWSAFFSMIVVAIESSTSSIDTKPFPSRPYYRATQAELEWDSERPL